ncbi:MAG: peptidoglycan-binding protein [Clostridia bacterium]|nr:peptidoglycan-binding protein [Clostridia bacterium]
MYELNDSRAAISAIQQLLRDAGYDIKPDGIYGDETYNAVREFQVFNRLPPTGRVDLETFEALARAARPIFGYQCALLIPETLEGGVISPGEESNVVVIIQSMLKTLSVVYDFEDIELTGVYDTSTESAIRDIQRTNGLPITGIVDPDTWNALVSEYEKFKDSDA